MNKIFGVSFVRMENASWNNNFDGVSRTNYEGTFIATDKARKYTLRQDFLNSGKEVLIRKHRSNEGKFKSLINILSGYNIDVKNKEANKDIFKRFLDVRLFGAIVNPSDNILTTTGPTQFLFAINQLIKDGERYNEQEKIDIISYKFEKTKENKADSKGNGDMTTIGKYNRVEKAYMMYPFIINPNVYYNNMKEILGEEISDEEISSLYNEDVEALKESMKYDVSELNSCSKMGCTNFINIVITMKDNLSRINLSAIQDNIFVEENENVANSNIDITINLINLVSMLEARKEEVLKIELHLPATKRFNVLGLEPLKNLGIELIEERI